MPVAAVHRHSGGIPRSVNNLCDTALMLGYAAQSRYITPDLIEEAAEDTGLADDSVAPQTTPQEQPQPDETEQRQGASTNSSICSTPTTTSR